MRHRAGSGGGGRSRRWSVATAVLVLAVVALLAGSLLRGDPSGDATVPAPTAASTTPSPSATSPTPTPGAASPAARPEHLTITDIAVSTDLLRLGLNADQTVEVPLPRDAAMAGWFDRGPSPGQDGSAVILGHVDSVDGPAVFHRLKELRVGSPVRVRLEDGSVARFEVTRTATYDNEEFPAREVYAGSPGRPTLNLVTCGGDYDADRGGWQSNVVVYTRLVGISAA